MRNTKAISTLRKNGEHDPQGEIEANRIDAFRGNMDRHIKEKGIGYFDKFC